MISPPPSARPFAPAATPSTLPVAALVARPAPVFQLGGRTHEHRAGGAGSGRGDGALLSRRRRGLSPPVCPARGPRILAYLTGLLGDKAAAEDMLQLTFLKVHEARSSYVVGANPMPVDLHDRPPHGAGRDSQAQAQSGPAEQGR